MEMLKKRKLLSTNLKLKCIQTSLEFQQRSGVQPQERLAPLGIMESPESICSPRQYGAEGIKGVMTQSLPNANRLAISLLCLGFTSNCQNCGLYFNRQLPLTFICYIRIKRLPSTIVFLRNITIIKFIVFNS